MQYLELGCEWNLLYIYGISYFIYIYHSDFKLWWTDKAYSLFYNQKIHISSQTNTMWSSEQS